VSNRYSWLNWQPIRMSRWLTAYLFLSVPFIFVPAFVIEMRQNGGHFVQAYRTISNQKGAYRVAVLLVFVDLAFLVWFTFFMKSKKVTDSDKFAVFIGICAFACILVVMVLRSGYLASFL
jgi:hypothetical protein